MEKERTSAISIPIDQGLHRVEVFKTTVAEELQADRVIRALSLKFPEFSIHFDLDDCDRILRIEGRNISNEQIIASLLEYGYECTVLV